MRRRKSRVKVVRLYTSTYAPASYTFGTPVAIDHRLQVRYPMISEAYASR
jgi:hypothetical protein